MLSLLLVALKGLGVKVWGTLGSIGLCRSIGPNNGNQLEQKMDMKWKLWLYRHL